MTKVIGDYTAAATIDGNTNYLLIQPGSSSTAYNKINRNTLLGVSGQPADLTTVQTVQNKVLNNTNTVTLKDTLLTLQDNADTSKQAQFELSGITSATTRTYTLPDASTTLVGTGATQTLTNKTLTSPTISGGTYDNGTITVDAIGGHTSANIVTVAGLQINNGALNTNNSVVTANITDSAVTPAKLQTGTGSGWSWSSWSPSYTNITIGNGTVDAKYVQIGKTVIGRWFFQMGSSSSVSTGPIISPPVAPLAAYYTTFGTTPTVGIIRINISSTGYSGPVFFLAANQMAPFIWNAGSTYLQESQITAAVPAAFGTGSALLLTFTYEVA